MADHKPDDEKADDERAFLQQPFSERTRELLRLSGVDVETREEFWAEMQRSEELANPSLRRRRAKATSLPQGEAPGRSRLRTRSCQVNVKLTPDDHEALKEAAREYGVAPATMAQMLVNRGLEAVERERQETGAAAQPAATSEP